MPTASIEKVSGRGIPLRGGSIDTDRIMPARYLRCVTFSGLEEHVFEDDRKAAGTAPHPFDVEAYAGARILVVGDNFGCGSSREHAPQGLKRWGISALVGVSFAEIFFGNCMALGVPCVTASPAGVERLQALIQSEPATEVTVDLRALTVTARRPDGSVETFPVTIPAGVRTSFLEGQWDATGQLLADSEAIDSVAERLPYVRGFA